MKGHHVTESCKGLSLKKDSEG